MTMIKLFPAPPNEPHPGHNVDVVKPIGNFKVGERLNIRVQPMSGRRYNPGKGKDGKWLDKEGRPEDRYMVFSFGSPHYAVGTKEELDAAFNE